MQVNYLDASEERGRDSDQSSYQQSDERESESESDGGQDFVGESVATALSTHSHVTMSCFSLLCLTVPGTKKRGAKAGHPSSYSDGLPPLLAKLKDNLYVCMMVTSYFHVPPSFPDP